MVLVIGRPRPVPPKRREDESSACSNALKMRAWACSSMPMPVSVTRKCSWTGLSKPSYVSSTGSIGSTSESGGDSSLSSLPGRWIGCTDTVT